MSDDSLRRGDDILAQFSEEFLRPAADSVGRSPGARPVSFYRGLRDVQGEVRHLTPRELLEVMCTAPTMAGPKESLPLWSPIDCGGRRTSLAHVRSISYLIFDVDECASTRCDVVANMPLECFAHASVSSRREREKFRIVLVTSRPHTPAEHPAVFAYGGAILAALGADPDPKSRDASHRYFVPVQGEYYGVSFNAGAPRLDVDEAVRIGTAILASDEREASGGSAATPAQLAGSSSCDVRERARRYLAKMPPSVSGQGGHGALFDAACALVRGFELDTATALELLANDFNGRCLPPWQRSALARKVTQATESTRPVGYLLHAPSRVA